MLTEMSRLFERRTLLNLISSHIWYLNKFLWLWPVSLFSVEFVFFFFFDAVKVDSSLPFRA